MGVAGTYINFDRIWLFSLLAICELLRFHKACVPIFERRPLRIFRSVDGDNVKGDIIGSIVAIQCISLRKSDQLRQEQYCMYWMLQGLSYEPGF